MSEAYTYPSHVHALSFVSIKLSGNTNYREWQEQMMCLVDSHDMIGFIDGTLKESQEITNDSEKKGKYRQWKRSDTLVKGWIFGSLSEHVMVNVVGLDTSNEVWDNLKAAYGTPRNIEMQEECPYPSNVNVANFVSILLEGETNYREWEAQMICLLESCDMLSFIDDTLEGGKYRDQKRSDTLVKGWIFGSLSEDVMATVVDLDTTNEVWSNLKATYGTPHNIEMKEEYPYPSNVNVANFVSIVLEGETNYWEWKEQMICLLESYDMLDFINGTLEKDKYMEWKRSDTLVKGWIFGSLSIGVIHTVWGGLDTAFEVWNKLTTSYNGVGSLGSPKIENTSRYLPLYKTILRGDWEAAREILNGDEDALTIKLNPEGYTALHIAIDEYADIQFVDRLLKEITPESLPTMLTNSKYNALHCAAMIGNIEAAKMLVEKNPNLLFIADMDHCLPVGRALVNSHITTFQYLLDSCIQHIGISKQDGYNSPFEGDTGCTFLTDVIYTGLMDVACELINKYPNMARKHYDIPLRYIAKKGDLYYSGTQYNFYQTFVYTHVPIEINNFDYTNNLQDIENQDTCNRKSISSNARRSCFYYVIQKIYAKFWNVVLLHVAHVKHLREEKVKHNKALILLKRICEEAGKTDEGSDISQHCGEAFKSAVQNDISEAVEEIMRYFPQAIWTKDNDYYPTQIAIRDRCLKAHNVMLRHLGRDKYLLHACYDIDSNNYLHLAGRLAPISKLNLVSGAALQMQREVQWFKGVESFERPQFKEAPNGKGETPIMVFRREHKELRKDGESWMKKTADSYTITAALIITIVFAAAITVPGGNDNSGKANYATHTSFFIFIISDAISLFTSTTSLLLFLSILTARYLEEDFLYRLPLRLILGLGMLFVSVTSMMVAFSATLYLTFGHGRAWIMYPVAVLACLPIASFVTLQLPLLFELINSTYYNRVFSKHRFPKIN